MRQYIKFIASILMGISSVKAIAQDSLQMQAKDPAQVIIIDSLHVNVSDSAEIELVDSTHLNVKKTYLFLGTDYGKLITTAAQLETKYEFNLGVQFLKNIRITADYGYSKLAPPNAIQNGSYTSSGNYYRLGLDYMINIMPKVYLSFGGMYALSSFKDEGIVEIKSEMWSSFTQSFARDNFSASWAEFIVTSEAPIVNSDNGFLRNLHWGIKIRLRFMIDRPSSLENFDVYAIPGYGRTFNNMVPAGNLFISYKL